MGEPVTLHVYDLGTHQSVQNINKVSFAIGGGLYHTAVEIYGKEYSFGYAEAGSGVFGCLPAQCNLHTYKQAVALGDTLMSKAAVMQLLREMAQDYQAQTYDLLNRNCHTFCQELATRLGVAGLPGFITRFPSIGSTTVATVQATREKARQIDEQFEISRKTNQAKEQLVKGISSAWSRAQVLGAAAAQKTKEFEQKHDVQKKVMMGAFRSMNFVNRTVDKICGNPDYEDVEDLNRRQQDALLRADTSSHWGSADRAEPEWPASAADQSSSLGGSVK